jgi:hypothetical protein
MTRSADVSHGLCSAIVFSLAHPLTCHDCHLSVLGATPALAQWQEGPACVGKVPVGWPMHSDIPFHHALASSVLATPPTRTAANSLLHWCASGSQAHIQSCSLQYPHPALSIKPPPRPAVRQGQSLAHS